MIWQGVMLALLAGLAITGGAWFAATNVFSSVRVREEVSHTITAVGGGALIGAIAFVLVPQGVEKQSEVLSLVTFAAGGVCFMLLDIRLARSDSNASQMIAMMSDFIPEAIVLGVAVTRNFNEALFLTIIIIAQNFPEGYAAFNEMNSSNKVSRKKLLRWFAILGLTGPLYSLLGTFVFVESQAILGIMMTFCAGGILYLVFEDVAPKVQLEQDWLPPLGAVLGFLIGMAGHVFL